MKKSFNILSAAWIPCTSIDGKHKMMSLADTVTNAHEIQSIQAEIPVGTASLYLFLIAFVNAIFKLQDDDAWENIWIQGAFSKEIVMAYAEKWVNRFDLFDTSHPFYQDPKFGKRKQDLARLKQGKSIEPRGLSGLLMHVASGSNPTLFDHSMDDQPRAYSPSEAAQLLIMLQAYSLGGLTSASIPGDKYYKDCAFSRGILFLSKGNNLFETIMLNLITDDFDPTRWARPDIPVWEREDPFGEERSLPGGISDLLTWQSRRILLIPEEQNGEIRVTNCFTAPGSGLLETFNNPFYHIRFDRSGNEIKPKLMRFMTERALWRDSGALLDVKTEMADVPIVIRWFDHLRASGIITNNMIRLDLFGTCTEPGKKKAFFYAHETFNAPAIYLENEIMLAELKTALSWAEEVGKTVYFSASELASFKLSPNKDTSEGKKPDPNAVSALINLLNIESYYWSQIEPFFYQFLLDLPKKENAKIAWQEKLKYAARKSLSEISDAVGSDAAGLKARAKAENKLEYGLSKLPDL